MIEIILLIIIIIIIIVAVSLYDFDILRYLSNSYLSSMNPEPLVLFDYKIGDLNKLIEVVNSLKQNIDNNDSNILALNNTIYHLETIIQDNIDEIAYLQSAINETKENIANIAVFKRIL